MGFRARSAPTRLGVIGGSGIFGSRGRFALWALARVVRGWGAVGFSDRFPELRQGFPDALRGLTILGGCEDFLRTIQNDLELLHPPSPLQVRAEI